MVVVAMTMQIYQGLGCPDLVAAKRLDYTTVGNRCWVAMLSCELLWLAVTTTTLWQQAVVLGCGVGVGVTVGVGDGVLAAWVLVILLASLSVLMLT